LWHTDRHVVHLSNIVDAGALLAWKVGAVGLKWAVVETVLPIGDWRSDFHVPVDGGDEQTTGSGCRDENFGKHREVVSE
jgi:hypothetical protein